MFTFRADIIKRRKVNILALFIGIIGAAMVGYLLPPFLKHGRINIVEDFIRQVGLSDFTIWIYIIVFGILLMTIIPAIKTVFQKKVVNGGFVQFDEENLKIVKGKTKFLIPGTELQEVNFEIKNTAKNKKDQLGGSFMKIPTQKGTFICELDLKEKEQQKDLDNIIKVLKIKHDVSVQVNEIR